MARKKSKDVKEVALVVSDTHSVYQDKAAVGAMMRVGDALEPDRVCHIGDLLDFYSLSKYEKDPQRMREATLEKEVRSVQPLIKWINETSKLPPIYTLGNHEKRLQTHLVHNVPSYYEYAGADIKSLLNLPERWQVYGYGVVPRLGQLGITHGDTVRTDAGASALAQRRKIGGSILHGHTHRMAAVSFSDSLGEYWAYEIGHLSERQPAYMSHMPNWQQGFAVVSVRRNGEFHVELVPIQKGKAWFRGEWY